MVMRIHPRMEGLSVFCVGEYRICNELDMKVRDFKAAEHQVAILNRDTEDQYPHLFLADSVLDAVDRLRVHLFESTHPSLRPLLSHIQFRLRAAMLRENRIPTSNFLSRHEEWFTVQPSKAEAGSEA